MHTRSAILFLLALFVRSVHTTGLDPSSPSVLVKRDSDPENGIPHKRPPPPNTPNTMAGLVEIRAPSDFDHIARSPTPVSMTEPDAISERELKFDPAPAPKATAKTPHFKLENDSPLLEYEGAEVLDKRANCPA